MWRIETRARLLPTELDAVDELLDTAAVDGGFYPLSDQFRLDLVNGGGPGFSAVLAVDKSDRIGGYAQLARANMSTTIEVVVAPSQRASIAELTRQLLRAAVSLVARDGGGQVHWWVQRPDGDVEPIASEAGLRPGRRLAQMRRQLPLDETTAVDTRAFVVGQDEAEWLRVNNAAFHDHPEQGGWTIDTLRQRQAEPWFDPDGFRLYERDGKLAAFCWTKVHTETTPPMGEIYVIAVDPEFHGLGLGRALTIAGLEHLADEGLTIAMLYVDAANPAAMSLYERLGFSTHHVDRAFVGDVPPDTEWSTITSDMTETLPRWSVSDVHESFEARSFVDAMERAGADTTRLIALFDEHGIRQCEPRVVSAADGEAADTIIHAVNDTEQRNEVLLAYVYARVSTDSFDEQAQGLLSELNVIQARRRPLLARLAEWVRSLGVDDLAAVSTEVADHRGPLAVLAARAEHQMSEAEEGLYSELTTTGSSAWERLHSDVTSQLTAIVDLPDGAQTLPMAAIRGLATDADPRWRRAAYEAELRAWPSVAVSCAAAMNSVKGEANAVNARRGWAGPLDASLFANNISRATFDAMQAAVDASLDDFRRWMRAKARLHGHSGALPWFDLFAPLPFAPNEISWTDGLGIVRGAFSSYSQNLGSLVDRAVDERWIDAAPRHGKRGGAFCMPFMGDRSLVLLNWNGSVDSAQTTAHELGHAYHNTQLAQRTALQKRLPMALAETASIFCETLVVEEGLQRLHGSDRLALLDVNLVNAAQVVVDIRSRFDFETDVFARRQRRSIGVSELNEMMLSAQADAYGDGLDQSTAHPYMWAVKPHYYGSHYYNWPYTYGLLFGLGLFANYREDPPRFQQSYDDVLSRAGMNTAEELGADFGFDVSDESFWTASLDVLRGHIDQYAALAAEV